MFYSGKKVFIAGGAGFIGHHLTNRLIQRGAYVTIGGNILSNSINNILRVFSHNNLSFTKTTYGYKTNGKHEFINVNFENFTDTIKVFKGHEIIFHLAATIGGRGYINTHPADCCNNFAINHNIIKAAHLTGIDRIHYLSSTCVYPCDLQKDYNTSYLLKETDAFDKNWANADREYGWAKLMGELMLKAYYKQYKLKSSIVRCVPVYGPWENDTHAIIALIRRAVERKEPYIVWGNGTQSRDFVFVEDVVDGMIVACEQITNSDVVNLGTSKKYKICDVISLIFDIVGWKPKKIIFDRSKPEGVKNRVVDISKAKKVLNWQPRYDLKKGLEKTIKWFIKEKPRSVETIK